VQSYAKRYRQELLESVIPFWLRHSLDREFGGYFTCLDRNGGVYDTRKYVWLQGRAAWTFSKLYNEVEKREEWLEAARLIVDFLRRYAFDSQGRCYFSLTREGLPSFYQRKPYAAVFVALGLLEYAKATGDRLYRREAIDLFWRIHGWIKKPALLDRPVLTGALQMTQLADAMVLISLAMEIATVDPDPRYRRVIRDCLDAAFLHHHHGVFVENAGPSLRALPEGRLFCPGSSIETAWFLLQALEFHPDAERQAKVLDSIENALQLGWDREYRGLCYFMDLEGRPTLQLESSMKLWWPHTEAIYALILAWSLTGEERWKRWLEKVDDYAFRHFADPEHGEWFGYCDQRGNLTHTLKGNNYKGCFHVPRALLLSATRLED
jgi:N-acylglucosamine 2-epimerase